MTDGEGAQSGANGTQSGAGESTTGTGETGTETTETAAQSGTGETNTTPSETERLAKDLADQRARTQAADKRASQIEAELKQLRDKDIPATEKLQRDFEEATKQRDEFAETNRSLALQVAFLKDNSVTWHNPERAMKILDLSNVEVRDDGTVSGLKEALTALAKSDPYLVKTETGTSGTPQGTASGTNGSAGSGKPKPSALVSRLPVMNTRVTRKG